MSRACVCGGSNENCRYCNGRGEIQDRLATALVSHTYSPTKVSGGRKSKRERQMEVDIEVRKVERRLERLRGPIATSVAAFKTSPKKSVPCPKGCGAKMRPNKVERHLRVAHASHPAVTTISRTAPAATNKTYVVCSVCKANVRNDRLARHINKVHGTRSRRAVAENAIPLPANEVVKKTTTFVAPREKNLDATRLYAHAYREQGRFGSHPSHDGFDDESSPD
jgi:hypothetical protein